MKKIFLPSRLEVILVLALIGIIAGFSYETYSFFFAGHKSPTIQTAETSYQEVASKVKNQDPQPQQTDSSIHVTGSIGVSLSEK